MQLEGAGALVTGGAVRLGRSLSLALAGRGARVVVHHGSSTSAAAETVAQIEAEGGEAVTLQADLSDPDQAAALVGRAADVLGPIDVLVNSAAIFHAGGWQDTTLADWQRHLAINLTAPFLLSQAFAAQVGTSRSGHVVNVADWRGARPGSDHVAYTVTKAALLAMTRSMAQGLAPAVQVNAIAPGLILPPPERDEAYLTEMAATIPAARVGSPQDVARAMLFLLDSDFVTGDVLFVTGGQHL